MKIIDRLPYGSKRSTVNTPVGVEGVKAYQIIVWVSLRAQGILSRPFPVVLDTGHSHNFSITEAILESWLGMNLSQFPQRKSVTIDGQKLPLRIAELVLHKNVAKEKTLASGYHELSIPQGIVVYPKPETFPRLPILGLRALTASNLRTVIDGRNRLVTIDTGKWYERLQA